MDKTKDRTKHVIMASKTGVDLAEQVARDAFDVQIFTHVSSAAVLVYQLPQ